jgi:hypothetical protein
VNHEGVTVAIAVSSRDRVLANFTEAEMRGAKLARSQGEEIPLSSKQRLEIDRKEGNDEEPPGGWLVLPEAFP